MASLRVTQGILVLRSMRNLNDHMRKILSLQDELSTGLRVNSPSDDPIDARRAIDARTSIGTSEQYLDNMSMVGPQLEETAQCVLTSIDIVERVRELTLQGANATNSQLQLDEIANEVNQLLEAMVVESNHQTNGRYIFSGTRTLQEAFTETRDANGNITAVTYNGNTEDINVAVADGIEITANMSGQEAFLNNIDTFQVLIDVRDDLLAGDYNSLEMTRLDELKTIREQLLRATAEIGAVQNRLDRTIANTEDFVVQLERVKSDSVDADYAETVINLNAASNAYQAGLNAAARTIQPSLLDYVR